MEIRPRVYSTLLPVRVGFIMFYKTEDGFNNSETENESEISQRVRTASV